MGIWDLRSFWTKQQKLGQEHPPTTHQQYVPIASECAEIQLNVLINLT